MLSNSADAFYLTPFRHSVVSGNGGNQTPMPSPRGANESATGVFHPMLPGMGDSTAPITPPDAAQQAADMAQAVQAGQTAAAQTAANSAPVPAPSVFDNPVVKYAGIGLIAYLAYTKLFAGGGSHRSSGTRRISRGSLARRGRGRHTRLLPTTYA